MKAIIKVVTAKKQFNQADLDCFRRMLNVLHEHDLAAVLVIKKKIKTEFTIDSHLKLKII
jgi:hypothetical protein